MGFFDAMKKVLGNAEQLKSQLDAASNTVRSVQQPTHSAPASNTMPTKKTETLLLESGSIPAKPSKRRTTIGFRGDDTYDVSFMLSGDFIEFNSHSEFDPSFQYEPNNPADYTSYLENYPSIYIGPDNRDAIETYRSCGTVGTDFKKIENGSFLFKARFEYHGQVQILYAFSEESAWDGHVLGLLYNPDIVGTPLEKKLIAALDEAAMTYTETKND